MEIKEEELKQSKDYDEVENYFYSDKIPMKFSNDYMIKNEQKNIFKNMIPDQDTKKFLQLKDTKDDQSQKDQRLNSHNQNTD